MKSNRLSDHLILIAGALFMLVPLWLIFASSTHQPNTIVSEGLQWTLGDNLSAVYREAWNKSLGFAGNVTAQTMIVNSMIMGLGFAIGKIVISMMAAYALVYFRLPYASAWFWLIFITLLLPLEVRIIPSYEVVSNLGMLNSYTGLVLPLIASLPRRFSSVSFLKPYRMNCWKRLSLITQALYVFIDIYFPSRKP